MEPRASHSNKAPVLVSACLLGDPCRYDGASTPCEAVVAFAREHEVVPICPEQLGELPTPRTPSEIQPDGRVVDREGIDRTEAFERGAREAVAIAHERGCHQAILKSRSPSCGVGEIYDGTFAGMLVPGEGKAAAALRAAGLDVCDELDFARISSPQYNDPA